MERTTSDVVVIGSGIVGASAAYQLVRAGIDVTLVDRSDTGYASGAGAGIIAPGTTFAPPPAFYPLVFASVAFYEELLRQLAEDGEDDPGYDVVGSLFVATDHAELDRLPEILEIGRERRAAGVHNIGEIQQVSGSEARELFPALADIPGAIHVSGSARMDARTMVEALRCASVKRGLRILDGDASIARDGDRVSGVQVNGETVLAENMIISAGAWSPGLVEGFGFSLPVSPQRGQIIHLIMPESNTSRWPIITGFHSHYQLTFPENRVVVGATRESDAGFDYRLTAGGIHEVLHEALRVSPGLAVGTVHETRIGFRPASPDSLPIIGRAPGYQNLYVATGHGASGLQLGPYSGATVARLVQGVTPEIDLGPFAVDRFQS